MPEIQAQLVNELRKRTQVGFGKCKEALIATDGDLAAAEEWLKRKNLTDRARTPRPTGEGVIAVHMNEDNTSFALVELRCETDFAARNERFRKFAQDLAWLSSRKTGDMAELLTARLGEMSVADHLRLESQTVIKEEIALGHVERRSLTAPGRIGCYLHSNGKLAALVGLHGAPSEKLLALAKDLAMHVAGSAPPPTWTDRAAVPLAAIEEERAFLLKQMAEDPGESKKPEAIRAKIAEGRLCRFYKEKVLLDQPFVKDDKRTIGRVLEDAARDIGEAPKVAWIVRRQLGS